MARPTEAAPRAPHSRAQAQFCRSRAGAAGLGTCKAAAGRAVGGVGATDDREAAADRDPDTTAVGEPGVSGRNHAGARVSAGAAPPAPGSVRAAGSSPGRSAGRFFRGGGRAGERTAQGVGVPVAADVFGARVRVAVRTLRSARLPRRPRAGIYLSGGGLSGVACTTTSSPRCARSWAPGAS